MSLIRHRDASKVWCPYSRIARREDIDAGRLPRLRKFLRALFGPRASLIGGVNRDALGRTSPFPYSCRCLGSYCGAWRWKFAESMKPEPGPHDRIGYCGLAGIPVEMIHGK